MIRFGICLFCRFDTPVYERIAKLAAASMLLSRRFASKSYKPALPMPTDPIGTQEKRVDIIGGLLYKTVLAGGR